MTKHVLVAGASGVVGFSALSEFARAGARVTALSRRPPVEAVPGVRFVPLDLTDAKASAEAAAAFGDVTHLIYAALHEEPGLIAGWREKKQIETNDRMLRNLFAPLERTAARLEHAVLLQGTKAYGAHIKPIDIPAREDRSELHGHENFYWQQERYIREAQAGKNWHWTILRPQIVFGAAIGAAMNLIPALGAWAAIRKLRGETLVYPGGAPSILEAVDADLLARVIAWSGDAQAARNQIFNLTNGDVFVWRNVWPAIADALGIEQGDTEPRSIAADLASADAAADWDRIRTRHDLRAPALADFIGQSHHYADFCLAYGVDRPGGAALVSTIKLRAAGFGDVIDTEAMLRKWFRWFQARKLLPA
jgi:nucleoside-diphosphate-sugar epimerase